MRTSNLLLFTGLSALIVTFAACGDDDEAPPPTTTGTTTTTGTGGSGGDTTATGGSGGDTTATGGTGGGVGGSGGSGGAGGGEQAIHGCTSATAEDLTGMNQVTITDGGNAWTDTPPPAHHRCIRVDAGTTVIWEGDFTIHPLRGGVAPNSPDATSPIELATPVAQTTTVVLPVAGTFPYYCEIHTNMNGVVYVE
jgi:plastocyanin